MFFGFFFELKICYWRNSLTTSNSATLYIQPCPLLLPQQSARTLPRCVASYFTDQHEFLIFKTKREENVKIFALNESWAMRCATLALPAIVQLEYRAHTLSFSVLSVKRCFNCCCCYSCCYWRVAGKCSNLIQFKQFIVSPPFVLLLQPKKLNCELLAANALTNVGKNYNKKVGRTT